LEGDERLPGNPRASAANSQAPRITLEERADFSDHLPDVSAGGGCQETTMSQPRGSGAQLPNTHLKKPSLPRIRGRIFSFDP